MGFLRYVTSNSVAKIMSDIEQYKELRHRVKNLKQISNEKYGDMRRANGCIKKELETQSLTLDTSDAWRQFEIVEYNVARFVPCEHLSEKLCLNENCPHFDENKNYICALQNYKNICDMKRRFWREKFNRVK